MQVNGINQIHLPLSGTARGMLEQPQVPAPGAGATPAVMELMDQWDGILSNQPSIQMLPSDKESWMAPLKLLRAAEPQLVFFVFFF